LDGLTAGRLRSSALLGGGAMSGQPDFDATFHAVFLFISLK
jgi:hypothetical protein